ncbi:MAG: autoantigen p27 domain-containing protein [Euryarchaeota archaeon]
MSIRRTDLNRMAEKLLAGYKMLGIHCPDCRAPLFQHPKTKRVVCPVCGAKFEVVKGKLTMVERGRREEAESGSVEGTEPGSGPEEAGEVEEASEEEEGAAEEAEEGEGEEEDEEGEEGEDEGEEGEETAVEEGEPRVRPVESEEELREVVMSVVRAWLDRAVRTEDPEEALRDLKVAERALKLLRLL